MTKTTQVRAARLDEVDVLRKLGAPFATHDELRDTIELVINGDRLSELLGGLPLDVAEVHGQLMLDWLWGGRNVTVGRCLCGEVDCIRARATVQRRGRVVEWVLPSINRTFRFDGPQLDSCLRRALADP